MKKSDINKVEPGERVKLSGYYKKFFREYAYEFNKIGGTEIIKKDTAEGEFFGWLLVGKGYPYTCKIIEYKNDVGNGPGFRVEFKTKCGVKWTCLIGYKDLIRGK